MNECLGCGALSSAGLTLRGYPICLGCAHRVSHGETNAGPHLLPMPVIDSEQRVIPAGTYPNIDWARTLAA